MLQSKVTSDVLESLEFLCCAQIFEIDGNDGVISKCLPLVWSQDERIRKAVLSTYVRLYLTEDAYGKEDQIIRNLLEIASNSTCGELISLEKLVGLMVSNGHVSALALKQLWHTYYHGTSAESILACQLLSMAVPTNSPDPCSKNLNHMVANSLVVSKGKFSCCLYQY